MGVPELLLDEDVGSPNGAIRQGLTATELVVTADQGIPRAMSPATFHRSY
ncbi:hypothetical protein O3S80_42455 [Streptomyces sp. Lzd4kr]|nr:hypothetical protein [Streptomyces sp. Lzd4kr]